MASLSDVARQNNSNRASKFAASMIPKAPEQTPPPAELQPEPSPDLAPEVKSLATVIEEGEKDFAEGKGTTFTADELQQSLKASEPAPAAKPARKRSGTLAMDDILNPKPPQEEVFGKMTRIAEKHHELLREIAFKHRKNMNTILYNLLEVLEQTYQREQQNNA